MSIKRTALSIDEQFTMIPNAWARDARLSRKARGLLVELLSHRVGWSVSVASLVRAGTEGRDAVAGAIRELEALGYLVREQERTEGGKFAEVAYTLGEPQVPPLTDYPSTDNPTTDNPHPKKTKTKKTKPKNSCADADAPVAGPAEDVVEEVLELEVIEEKPAYELIAKRAYDATAGALPYMGMRGIAKWALEVKGAEPQVVEEVIAGLYRSGQAVTKAGVGQVLDGYRSTAPRGASAVERRLARNAQVADQWLEARTGAAPSIFALETGVDQ